AKNARPDPIERRTRLVPVIENRRSIVRFRLLALADRDDADDLHAIASGILDSAADGVAVEELLRGDVVHDRDLASLGRITAREHAAGHWWKRNERQHRWREHRDVQDEVSRRQL